MTETRELEGSTRQPPSATVRRVDLAIGTLAAWIALLRVNEPLWDRVVYRRAGLDEDSRLGSAVHFFLFDTVKITLLLTGILRGVLRLLQP